MPKIQVLFILFSLFLTTTQAQSPTETPASGLPRYAIDDTEVRTVRSEKLGREYRIFVALPESYAASPQRRYPVVYVTDANYAFPLIRAISRRVGDHGKGYEDFILVGLSYAVGDTPEYSRRRDYTPSAGGDADAVSDMPGRKPAFGEAEAYRVFLRDEVLPVVEKNYRADPRRRVFAGHSYGGLLGAHMLFAEPSMFSAYVLSSPSFWWDGKQMLARAQEFVRTHKTLDAGVFLVIGSYETVKPESHDARYNRTKDMVADLRRFEAILKAPRYAGLRVESKVIDDEDHLTMFPDAITRALTWAVPPLKH